LYKNELQIFSIKVIRSASLATPLTTGVGEDERKKEPSYTVSGNVN
jgi:hypothetical protein